MTRQEKVGVALLSASAVSTLAVLGLFLTISQSGRRVEAPGRGWIRYVIIGPIRVEQVLGGSGP